MDQSFKDWLQLVPLERRAEFEQLVRELLPKREPSSPARGRTLPKAPK